MRYQKTVLLLNLGYCDLVTTVVVVTAMNDGNENITTSGGTSVSNVLVNDRIAGAQATTSNIILTQISSTNANITLNTSTGAVNVALVLLLVITV
jgi:hypothetical protein